MKVLKINKNQHNERILWCFANRNNGELLKVGYLHFDYIDKSDQKLRMILKNYSPNLKFSKDFFFMQIKLISGLRIKVWKPKKHNFWQLAFFFLWRYWILFEYVGSYAKVYWFLYCPFEISIWKLYKRSYHNAWIDSFLFCKAGRGKDVSFVYWKWRRSYQSDTSF